MKDTKEWLQAIVGVFLIMQAAVLIILVTVGIWMGLFLLVEKLVN